LNPVHARIARLEEDAEAGRGANNHDLVFLLRCFEIAQDKYGQLRKSHEWAVADIARQVMEDEGC